MFHQGVPSLAGRLGDPQVRARLADGAGMGLSPAAAQAVAVALRRMDEPIRMAWVMSLVSVSRRTMSGLCSDSGMMSPLVVWASRIRAYASSPARAESAIELAITKGRRKGETLTLRQVTRLDKGRQVHVLTGRAGR